MFRFIHTSDLHLGKRFGNFSGDLPSRLREARHQIIAKLANLARENHATTILIAGDTFDSETPAADVRRQAMSEMAAHGAIKWVILPGNHDSLQALPLWETLQKEAAPNIILATKPEPIELAHNVMLLPAPVTARRVGQDLTVWMDGYTTSNNVIRIGLAHGAIRSFGEEGNSDDIIAPDRAQTARLDYLALGDWHGHIAVNPRTYYCGTPEPDRFKHQQPGTALQVTIAAPQAIPEVKTLATASFRWLMADLQLFENDDPLQIVKNILPEMLERRHTLARFHIHGYSCLSARSALVEKIEELRPDFAFLDYDDRDLAILYETQDLDAIDQVGALRAAADELRLEAEDHESSLEQRTVASAALARLYHYAQGLVP